MRKEERKTPKGKTAGQALAMPLLDALHLLQTRRRQASPAGSLSRGQFHLLKMLHHLEMEYPEGVRVGVLARRMEQAVPTVSQSLRELEGAGFVRRQLQEQDRRVICVALTPAGKEVLQQHRQRMEQYMAAVATRFGEEKTRQFCDLLQQFSAVLEEMEQKGGEDTQWTS